MAYSSPIVAMFMEAQTVFNMNHADWASMDTTVISVQGIPDNARISDYVTFIPAPERGCPYCDRPRASNVAQCEGCGAFG